MLDVTKPSSYNSNIHVYIHRLRTHRFKKLVKTAGFLSLWKLFFLMYLFFTFLEITEKLMIRNNQVLIQTGEIRDSNVFRCGNLDYRIYGEGGYVVASCTRHRST